MSLWIKSRAQWARIIAVVATALASIGIVPEFVPLLGALSDAIAAGQPVAVIGALLGIVAGIVGFFDRDKRDKEFEETTAATKAVAAEVAKR